MLIDVKSVIPPGEEREQNQIVHVANPLFTKTNRHLIHQSIAVVHIPVMNPPPAFFKIFEACQRFFRFLSVTVSDT